MKKNMVFLVKDQSALLGIVLVHIVITGLAFLIQWQEIKQNPLYGGILTALIALPFVVYYFSGWQMTINTYKKSLTKSFSLMGWHFRSQTLSIPLLEVFIVPELSESTTQQGGTICNLSFHLYIGEYKKQSLHPAFVPDPQLAQSLQVSALSFKHTEKLLRKVARRLFIPARIHWEELSFNPEKQNQYKETLQPLPLPGQESKKDHELGQPFQIPQYLVKYIKAFNPYPYDSAMDGSF